MERDCFLFLAVFLCFIYEFDVIADEVSEHVHYRIYNLLVYRLVGGTFLGFAAEQPAEWAIKSSQISELFDVTRRDKFPDKVSS